jgi:hypothetical protein
MHHPKGYIVMNHLKRLSKIYLNSSWLSSIITCFLFFALSLCVLLGIGCSPLSWIPPSKFLEMAGLLLCVSSVLSLIVSLLPVINQTQKRKKKGIITFSLFILSLLIFITGSYHIYLLIYGPILCQQSPVNRAYAIENIEKIADLAPLPKNRRSDEIKIIGTAFDRTFLISFEASESDVKAWIESSPSLQRLTPKKLNDGSLKYLILDGEGGRSANLTISNQGKKVEIKVAWWL